MAQISYDGQSFTVEGRRLWLVSGAIHYTRTPRDLWRQRLRAARQAGLNCIDTYVFWNAHEPAPGRFDFDGDLDLRRFIEMVGEEGMFCILRPGPYVCAEWDFGGLPPWLLKRPGIRLRQGDPAFLEACARYLAEVMRQIAPLQVTRLELRTGRREGPADASPAGGTVRDYHELLTSLGLNTSNAHSRAADRARRGGPVLLTQLENEWFCHHPDAAANYLGELMRYLRENGCETPLISCNNLWQRVDGTIDAWNASRHLATDLRQLRTVQPEAPRLVSEYWTGWFDHWGGEHHRAVDADTHLARLAEILAAGAQYNLYMFHGGTHFGFTGGRTVTRRDAFITTSYDYDAPLREAGGRGRKYAATKRISVFASQFAHVLANLEPDHPHAAVAPDGPDHPISVVHLTGHQGDAVFLLRGERDRAADTRIMLPNGLSLPVHFDGDRAAWLLLDANLHGVATLDYANLRPWALIHRRLLVLFGPPGTEALASIDETPLRATVPSGAKPRVETVGDLSVAILSTEQVDAAYLTPDGLVVGIDGFDDDGQPVPLKGWFTRYHVGLDGDVTGVSQRAPRKPTAPKLGPWRCAPDPALDPDAEYRSLDGPASFEQLDNPDAYGWYRIELRQRARGRLLIPHAADRLHLYADGKLLALVGEGPGAQAGPVSLSLPDTLTVLADQLGRFNYGQRLGERTGLFGDLCTVRQLRLPKPRVVECESADPFALSAFVPGQRLGPPRPADALAWTIKPAGRKPVVLEIDGLETPGVLTVNGEPLAIYGGEQSARYARIVLTPGQGGFTGGKNNVRLVLYRPYDPALRADRFVRAWQVTGIVSDGAAWAFRRWQTPEPDRFTELPTRTASRPTWFISAFEVADARVPLWLEPRGMSKGHVFLNGRNVGRYFVSIRTGQAVPPQQRYYLPEPWLRTDAPNELTLFDEHGRDPSRCRLVYDPMGPYGE